MIGSGYTIKSNQNTLETMHQILSSTYLNEATSWVYRVSSIFSKIDHVAPHIKTPTAIVSLLIPEVSLLGRHEGYLKHYLYPFHYEELPTKVAIGLAADILASIPVDSVTIVPSSPLPIIPPVHLSRFKMSCRVTNDVTWEQMLDYQSCVKWIERFDGPNASISIRTKLFMSRNRTWPTRVTFSNCPTFSLNLQADSLNHDFVGTNSFLSMKARDPVTWLGHLKNDFDIDLYSGYS